MNERKSPANNSNTKSTPIQNVAVCDVEQTTCFNDDKLVQSSARPSPYTGDTQLIKSVQENRTHTIMDFLQRPIMVNMTAWTTSMVRSTLVARIDFPAVFMSNTMYANKISSFVGFKATTCIRIVINADRFQQGRLLACWYPAAQDNIERSNLATSNCTYATQLPRMDIDVATDTEVLMEFPYVHPCTHYNVPNIQGTFGSLYIIVYSPLTAPTGSTSLNVQTWASCKDIDLSYPAMPQSGGVVRARHTLKDRKALREREQEAVGGSISSILGGVSGAAHALGGIPILNPMMKPLAWMTSILAGTATSLGFSKPTNSAPVTTMISKAFANMGHVTGFDTSVNMGYFADNSVADFPGFGGTTADEMSFERILSTPTFQSSQQWTNSNAQDVVLFNTAVCPASFYVPNTSLGTSYVDTTPVYYIGSNFRLWRGSFTFTFKVVKTEFHSGRLLFVFNPATANTTMTIANSCSLYREIFDLRLSNEFSVTVPYVCTVPYAAFASPIGYISLIVETPLKAPTTVNASVDVIMEISCGPDFEFAVPFPNSLEAVNPAYPQALGVDITTDPASSSTPIVAPISDLDSGGLAPAALCIGEKITSVRQLIKRFGLIYSSSSSTQAALNFTPSVVRINYFPKTTAGASIQLCTDNFDIFGVLFAFRRGAVRVKIMNSDTTVTQQHYNCTLSNTATGITRPGSTGTAFSSAYLPAHSHVVTCTEIQSGGGEFEHPHYSAYPFLINRPYKYDNTVDLTSLGENCTSYIYTSNKLMSQVRFYRAAADDFSFGYFVGTVPLVANTAFITQVQTAWW